MLWYLDILMIESFQWNLHIEKRWMNVYMSKKLNYFTCYFMMILYKDWMSMRQFRLLLTSVFVLSRATIVKNMKTYWVGVESEPLKHQKYCELLPKIKPRRRIIMTSDASNILLASGLSCLLALLVTLMAKHWGKRFSSVGSRKYRIKQKKQLLIMLKNIILYLRCELFLLASNGI